MTTNDGQAMFEYYGRNKLVGIIKSNNSAHAETMRGQPIDSNENGYKEIKNQDRSPASRTDGEGLASG